MWMIDGRIVLIPNADPGYDWLLARPIAGLVTMYGGANSHMAVRAAELSLPAAIGVGELLYGDLELASSPAPGLREPDDHGRQLSHGHPARRADPAGRGPPRSG